MKKLILFLFCACFSVGMYAADYYVDGSVGTSGTGASWDSPFKTIAAAVSAATGNGSIAIQDSIFIKQGTYAERIALTVTNTDKISIKGSYASASTGTDRTQRSLISSPTILDGTSLGAGSPALSISKASGSADMLIIQNFLATGTSQGTPGGLSIAISTAVVSNCIIRNNTHTTTGLKGSAAGVYMTGGKMQDCEIYGNVLTGTSSTPSNTIVLAGGIQTIGGTIDRCKIYNNTATGGAGGIFVGKVNTSYAVHDYLAISADVTISNCAIYNNGKEGILVGLLSTGTKVVTLTNNTIVNNESKNYFKAAAATTPFALSDISSTYLIATNNIFSNNGAVEDFTILSSMTHNAINRTSVSGTGNIALANTNTAAGFVSPSTVNGYSTPIDASVTSANWNLEAASVCKDAGTGSGNGSTDIAGSARVVNTTIDMGAYEAAGYFRTKASGNWTTLDTWQRSDDNSSWSNATFAPTSSAAAINILVGHEVTLAATASASTLTVNAGGMLTLNNGISLTATNLTLKSSVDDGTATFKDLGGTLTLTNPVIVEQNLGVARNWYMGSPVSGAVALPTVNTGSLTFYSYPENDVNQETGANGYAAGAVWNTISSGTLAPKTGYIVKPSVAPATVTFSGTGLNTGDQTITGLTYTAKNPKSGFNLISNPYPSYLNVLSSITTNSNLEATVWYRTRDTELTPLYHNETVNATSGVGTNAAGTGRVTGYIPPMQAFWVRATANNQSITLSNGNRSHAMTDVSMSGYPNTPTTSLKAPAANNQAYPLLGLRVSNGTYGDETIVMFASEATNGLDAYDSGKMTNANSSIPEIYTVVDGKQLAINTMTEMPFDTEIPLGFTAGKTGTNFSIKASQISNLELGTKIILKDYLDINNPVQTDLSDGNSYSFASDIENNTTRFSLVFRAQGSIAGLENTKLNAQVYVNAANQITIIAPEKSNYAIYNAVGQKQYENKLLSNKTTINMAFGAGVYFVALSANGQSDIRKVVIR